MSRYAFALVVWALALSLISIGGCSKPTHESLRKDAVGKMNDLTAVLKGVTDEASAKAAGPKIQALSAEMKKLKEQADALPKLSTDEEKKLDKANEKEMEEAVSGMMKEMMRIGVDPKLSTPLADAMKQFQKDMAEKP